MGVTETDKWLKEELDHPIKICEKLLPFFKGKNANEIYNQLLKFGMYKPSRSVRSQFNLIVKEETWALVKQFYQKYKKKWKGPDIPIFIFPLGQTRSIFSRQENNKSGVSYSDKMFLFISHLDDLKELEALFVHEYHHVCRLSMLNKKMDEYTLMDSIIIEGLAEYAVLKNCGREYLAKWCGLYSEKETAIFWDKYLLRQLGKRKNERTHDDLLYGGGRIPNLLGYAIGFSIVEKYYKVHNYSTKLSFTTPALKYIEAYNKSES